MTQRRTSGIERFLNSPVEYNLNLDHTFRVILDKELWPDIYAIMNAMTLPGYDRSEEEKNMLNHMKIKYASRSCPSFLFPFVSKILQDEWYTLQGMIDAFLWK